MVSIHHTCIKDGKRKALTRNIICMHISSSTEHHSYLPKSGPFELINSAERRQVLKLGIATKECSLNKTDTFFSKSRDLKEYTSGFQRGCTSFYLGQVKLKRRQWQERDYASRDKTWCQEMDASLCPFCLRVSYSNNNWDTKVQIRNVILLIYYIPPLLVQCKTHRSIDANAMGDLAPSIMFCKIQATFKNRK